MKMSNLAEINAGRIDEVLNDPPSPSYDTGRKYYVLSYYNTGRICRHRGQPSLGPITTNRSLAVADP